jgi:hypothetical protein
MELVAEPILKLCSVVRNLEDYPLACLPSSQKVARLLNSQIHSAWCEAVTIA